MSKLTRTLIILGHAGRDAPGRHDCRRQTNEDTPPSEN
jgi:hypothetical protein